MWSVRSEELGGARGLRCSIESGAGPIAFAEAIRAWREDAGFRALFNAMLAEAPYAAFRWETPPVASDTLQQPFECAILDSPGLDRRADTKAFEDRFARAKDGIATFPNLGGDATMIVPCPLGDPAAYVHLASFARNAPEAQRHALWRAVGEAMTCRVGQMPVWLSTAGAGVPWLHVRLDDRPKYYGYALYRR